MRVGDIHVKWGVRERRVVLIVKTDDPHVPVDRELSEHPNALNHQWPGDPDEDAEVYRTKLKNVRNLP